MMPSSTHPLKESRSNSRLPSAPEKDAPNANTSRVRSFFWEHASPRWGIPGATTELIPLPWGDLPNWLSDSPSRFAVSLYRYLVSDQTWHQAHAAMGYRILLDEPLVLHIDHTPYLDLRAWLSSRLPASLGGEIENNAINFALREAKSLQGHPQSTLERLLPIGLGLSDSDIQASAIATALTPQALDTYTSALRALTQTQVDVSPSGSLARALDRIRVLEANHNSWPLPESPLRQAFALLEAIRQFGMLPLATLRRHAQIADHVLKSAVEIGLWSSDRYRSFRQDFEIARGEETSDLFSLEDIADESDTSGRPAFTPAWKSCRDASTEFVLEERRAWSTALRTSGFSVTPETWATYAAQAFQGCYHADAVVKPMIRSTLRAFARWASNVGLSQNELEYVSLMELKESLYAPFTQPSWESFQEVIAKRRREASEASRIQINPEERRALQKFDPAAIASHSF